MLDNLEEVREASYTSARQWPVEDEQDATETFYE
jgi:hypothetical protein